MPSLGPSTLRQWRGHRHAAFAVQDRDETRSSPRASRARIDGVREAPSVLKGVLGAAGGGDRRPLRAMRRRKRSMCAGFAGGRSSATHHGMPSGFTPSPRNSPPISTRKSRQPAPRKTSATLSTAKPLAMEDRSRCTPPGCLAILSPVSSTTRFQPQRARAAAISSPLGTARREPRGPKPHRSTSGPTLGSKAPSVSRATASAIAARVKSRGRPCQFPAAAMKRCCRAAFPLRSRAIWDHERSILRAAYREVGRRPRRA